MTRVGTPVRLALALAAFLASLSLVAWRQGRAYQVMQSLEDVRFETGLATAERAELERNVQFLSSRARIVPEARERFGMRVAVGEHRVFLPGDAQ